MITYTSASAGHRRHFGDATERVRLVCRFCGKLGRIDASKIRRAGGPGLAAEFGEDRQNLANQDVY